MNKIGKEQDKWLDNAIKGHIARHPMEKSIEQITKAKKMLKSENDLMLELNMISCYKR